MAGHLSKRRGVASRPSPRSLEVRHRIDSFATASLAAGLSTLVSWLFVFLVPGVSILAALGPILAVIFGYQARKRIKLSSHRVRGRALARAGLALGFAELGVYLLFFLLILFYLRSGALYCNGQCLP